MNVHSSSLTLIQSDALSQTPEDVEDVLGADGAEVPTVKDLSDKHQPVDIAAAKRKTSVSNGLDDGVKYMHRESFRNALLILIFCHRTIIKPAIPGMSS